MYARCVRHVRYGCMLGRFGLLCMYVCMHVRCVTCVCMYVRYVRYVCRLGMLCMLGRYVCMVGMVWYVCEVCYVC